MLQNGNPFVPSFSKKVGRPPKYTLQFEDGSSRTVSHSQFILNSGPITAEESQNLDDELNTQNEVPVAAPPPLRKEGSWLKHKADSQKMERQSSQQGPSEAELTVPPVIEDQPLVPTDPPPYSMKKNATLMPDPSIGSHLSLDSPRLTAAADVSRVPVVPSVPSGFEPDTAAIQQATTFAHDAANALGFCDVELAIKSLQDALKCLTHPPS